MRKSPLLIGVWPLRITRSQLTSESLTGQRDGFERRSRSLQANMRPGREPPNGSHLPTQNLWILTIELLIDHPFGLHQAAACAAALYVDGPNPITRVRQASHIIKKDPRVQFIGQRYVEVIGERS